jgi:hypothetical protein
MNVKSPNNISKWQMGFNSAFKGLMLLHLALLGWDAQKLYALFTGEAPFAFFL